MDVGSQLYVGSRPRFCEPARERQADFIDIVVWRKQAELCGQYLGKGRLVALEGRLQIRSYETQEGQKRKVAEVVADNIRFLDRGRADDRTGEGQEHAPEANYQNNDEDDLGNMSLDDLPF